MCLALTEMCLALTNKHIYLGTSLSLMTNVLPSYTPQAGREGLKLTTFYLTLYANVCSIFFYINYLIFLNLDICEPFSYLLILTPLVYFTVKRFVISYLSSYREFLRKSPWSNLSFGTHTHTHTHMLRFHVLWDLSDNDFLYCTNCIFYPLTSFDIII